MEEKSSNKKTIASEYEKLKSDREMYIQAGREAARYTLPAIAPDNNDITTKKSKKKTFQPNQSVGADGVNNLASKVTLALLPPNQTFFKFKVDKSVIKKLAEEQGLNPDEFEQEVTTGLSKLETMLLDYQERFNGRVCLGEA